MRVRRHDRGRFFPEALQRPVTCKYTNSRPDYTSYAQSRRTIAQNVTLNPSPARTVPGGQPGLYQNSGSQPTGGTRGPRRGGREDAPAWSAT
jgi:hypothetical protein